MKKIKILIFTILGVALSFATMAQQGHDFVSNSSAPIRLNQTSGAWETGEEQLDTYYLNLSETRVIIKNAIGEVLLDSEIILVATKETGVSTIYTFREAGTQGVIQYLLSNEKAIDPNLGILWVSTGDKGVVFSFYKESVKQPTNKNNRSL